MDDKRLDRIEDKLDKVLDRASSTDVTLAKQSVILDDHVRRTELLENIVMPMKSKFDTAINVAKIVAAIAGGSGVTHGILHYLMKLY